MSLLRNPEVLRELALNSKQRVAIDNLNFGAIGGNDATREADRAVANLDDFVLVDHCRSLGNRIFM